MATLRQINANQLNSLHSTGPKTAEGKAASRANALKHGLSGAGIVLPDEEKVKVAERAAQWSSTLQPGNEVDSWLVDLVATESVRVECCRTIEASKREDEARRAGETWDDDRRLAAARLASRLSKRPELVALELTTTTQGVDLLLERWENLAALLEKGDWNDAQKSMALDLLGVARDQREEVNPLIKASRADGIGLKALVAQQIDKLTSLKPILDIRDGREQASAMLGIGETSAALHRIQRYEAACLRRFQWAYSRLKSMQRNARPASPPILPADQPASPPLLVNGRLTASLKEPAAVETVNSYGNSPASAPYTTPYSTVAVSATGGRR